MSLVIKVVGGAIIALFLSVLLRELGFKGFRLVTLIFSIAVLTAGISLIEALWGTMGEGEFGKEYAVSVMKIVGIAYISGACSDMCLEFGEITLSNAVLLFGKAEMLVLSIPNAIDIVSKGAELLG